MSSWLGQQLIPPFVTKLGYSRHHQKTDCCDQIFALTAGTELKEGCLKSAQNRKYQSSKMCKSQNRRPTDFVQFVTMLMIHELHNWLLFMLLKPADISL